MKYFGLVHCIAKIPEKRINRINLVLFSHKDTENNFAFFLIWLFQSILLNVIELRLFNLHFFALQFFGLDSFLVHLRESLLTFWVVVRILVFPTFRPLVRIGMANWKLIDLKLLFFAYSLLPFAQSKFGLTNAKLFYFLTYETQHLGPCPHPL